MTIHHITITAIKVVIIITRKRRVPTPVGALVLEVPDRTLTFVATTTTS